ncbi:MAG: HD domain-containing protein [Treponema sp.]|jgi:response regulator RpfG family c-di-GMP phosphodiesterase|nr:HD domain-containing protein [Treponema sp.]
MATSGKYTEKNEFGLSDYLIRYVLMNFIIIFGVIVLAAFAAVNFIKGWYFTSFICTGMIIIGLSTFIVARTRIRQFVPSLLMMIFYGLMCVMITLNGEAGGANFLFIYMYPSLAIMLLGIAYGSALSAILVILISLEMFVPGLSDFDYHLDFSIRMLVNYILVFSVMIVIEITRRTKDRTVEAQRKTLKKQSEELQYFNDNLQKLVDEKTENILDLQNTLLKTMAELVECRDDITGGHIERTQNGLRIILEEIERSGLYTEETRDWNIDLLLQSCQLHDLGKITISDNILKKPGKLTAEEFATMKEHAGFGGRIIEKIETYTKKSDFLKYAKIFAVSHHEKWDGSGYPYGLAGNKIPLLGRIMAIADVYDALVSVRPYKKALTHEEAVNIIVDGREKHFDPALVEIFTSVVGRLGGK